MIERLDNHKEEDQGVFLQMGNTVESILGGAGHKDWLPRFSQGAMRLDDVTSAERTPTVIRKLTPTEYENLYHHGFEVADTTLCAYYPESFQHIAYTGHQG
jgi:hypothetical protein